MNYSYYECLLRRLPKSHEQYEDFQEEFLRLDAGLNGEQRVARELLDIPTPFLWLENYQCISPQNTPHQIDFIILSSNFALVLEVKNISGDLNFHTESKEFSRARTNGQTDYFRSPFDQAFRHQQLLEQLFTMWNIPLPVTYAVVNTNSNARIGSTFANLPIFYVSYLRIFLKQLTEKYPAQHVNLGKLKEKLITFSVTLKPRKLVPKEELLTGIRCTVCHSKMIYHYGLSTCLVCKHNTRNGIIETLRDYYFLVDPTISNPEFRWFSDIDSKFNVSKILSRLSLERIGNNRSTRYIISEELINKVSFKKTKNRSMRNIKTH